MSCHQLSLHYFLGLGPPGTSGLDLWTPLSTCSALEVLPSWSSKYPPTPAQPPIHKGVFPRPLPRAHIWGSCQGPVQARLTLHPVRGNGTLFLNNAWSPGACVPWAGLQVICPCHSSPCPAPHSPAPHLYPCGAHCWCLRLLDNRLPWKPGLRALLLPPVMILRWPAHAICCSQPQSPLPGSSNGLFWGSLLLSCLCKVVPSCLSLGILRQ